MKIVPLKKRRYLFISVILTVLYICFLLQDAISYNFIGVFSYFDEVETLGLLCITFIYYIKKQKIILKRNNLKIVITLFLFLLIGVLGNFKSQGQTFLFSLLDVLTCIKFLINLMCIKVLFKNKNGKAIEDTLYLVSTIMASILFIITIHDIFFNPFFEYLTDRYNMHSLKLFFSNQTYLASTGIFLIIVFTAFGKRHKYSSLFIFFSIIVTFSTFRTKALGFIAIYVFYLLYMKRQEIKHILVKLILIGIISLLVASRYIYQYFFSVTSNKYSPRKILMLDSLYLAKSYFPVGTGFGTFCSAAANMNYSNIYSMLGYRTSALMSAGTSLNDILWACILGQFGFIGSVLFLFFLLYLFIRIIRINIVLKQYFYALLLSFIYLLIASFGECSFFSPYSIGFGALMGYLMSRKYQNNT